MFDYDENFLKVTQYEVLGELPNPFVFNDGTRVKTPADWPKRRAELYKTAIELQYGTMPPAPEFVEVEPLYLGSGWRISCYRITSGTRENPVSFTMYVHLPKQEGPCPVAITGDMCFPLPYERDYVQSFTENGVALVMFNRTEIVPDVATQPPRQGSLYKAYPECSFGAIGAWAWGYSRCVDALEQLNLVDMGCIAFTGLSRGGKTAALAGALDERAAIVNPHETCAGACSCYRLHMRAITEDGDERPSETLKNLVTNFPFWMGPELIQYADREAELPFDAHDLKAMIAPRVLLIGEAASDIWANPIGSWQTSEAAKEVYKFLGKEENLLWYFRTGYHDQTPEDVAQLINVIRHTYYGDPLNDKYFKTPFRKPDPMFHWHA